MPNDLYEMRKSTCWSSDKADSNAKITFKFKAGDLEIMKVAFRTRSDKDGAMKGKFGSR